MQSLIFSIITQVFSVTWSFRNHLICWKFLIIINVEKSFAASYFWFFEEYLVYFATFDQFKESLLNKNKTVV